MVKRLHIRDFIAFVFIIVLILFLCFPFIPFIVWSFTKQWPWPQLIPETWSLDSWTYLFSPSGRAIEGLINSLIVAISTLIGNLLLGIPAARVLAQKSFKGQGFMFITLLSPLFIPFTVAIMGLHSIALKLDFLNVYVSVTIAHMVITLPYFIASIWFQYRLIGTKLQEAAKVLGANSWRVFQWIEWPLLIPAVLLGSLLVIIISMSQYLPTWIMSGGTLLTLPLIIFPFANNGNASIVSAYSILFFLPIIFLVMVYYILLQIQSKKGRTIREDKHAV